MARSRMGLACSGVPIDDAAAVMWYRKAAEKCHKDAAHLHKNKKFAFWSLVFFLFHTARAALFFPGHWGSRVMSFRCATRRSLTFVAAASASAYARMSFTQPPSPVQKMQRAP